MDGWVDIFELSIKAHKFFCLLTRGSWVQTWTTPQISRIRADQIAVVLKPFRFGLIHRSGHARLVCKSIGPYASILHPPPGFVICQGFGGWKEVGLVILVDLPTAFKEAF